MNERNWRQDLWGFFAAAIGFWIAKPDTSRVERVLVGVVTLMIVVLTVFM